MDFISNQQPQIKAMLDAIGIGAIDELFSSVPKQIKLPPQVIDDGLSEFEGMRHMEKIASKNTFPLLTSYLGAGAYEHHIPPLAASICSKSEFLTSYTPYQAEASQGILQAIFEFQSAICALTGMDISNASLYDGSTACSEALLMALRYQKGRGKVVIARSLHPHYAGVVEQYLNSLRIPIEWIPFDSKGKIDVEIARQMIDENTAAILLQYPNFFGVIEDIAPLAAEAKAKGALTVVCANPLAYGLFASASEIGADIAVGDVQPLGLPLQFGGPYAGYLACKQGLLRQIPGRIVGETMDTEGRRGFVLTLQAREQHIRREKATSNICTNQALSALASLITMLWYGKEGLRKLALTNYQRAAYLKNQLEGLSGLKVFNRATHFNEFVVSFDTSLKQVFERFRENGIEPGLDLGRFYPEFYGCLLVAVTETKSKDELDDYVKVAKELYD